MPPKKASKPEQPDVPIQPVPEKRGYEFGGPYVYLDARDLVLVLTVAAD